MRAAREATFPMDMAVATDLLPLNGTACQPATSTERPAGHETVGTWNRAGRTTRGEPWRPDQHVAPESEWGAALLRSHPPRNHSRGME